MWELRIHDELEDGSGALIRFGAFIRIVAEVFGEAIRGNWEISRGADGYGLKVCAICDAVEEKGNSVLVDSDELLPVLLTDEEYFWDARITVLTSGVVFGIFDSTWYYVRADRKLLEKVAAYFKAGRILRL